MDSENSPDSKTSLSTFVGRNEKVLAAVGVFVALSAFFISLPLKSLSTFIAFLSLLATLPLLFELGRDLLRSNNSLSLIVFSNVFSLFVGYFGWYVLIAFREQWWSQMHKVVFWTLFLGLLGLYRRFLRHVYQKFFTSIALRTERFAQRFWNRLVAIQLRIWSHTHFLTQVFVYGRFRFSALRWKIRNRAQLDEVYLNRTSESERKMLARWESSNLSNEIQALGTVILFIPIFVLIGQIEKPLADLINTGLDIKAEEYRRIDLEQPKYGGERPAVPPPIEPHE